MSGGNSLSQGVYAPLPQSISDTDSEEELHSRLNHQRSKISEHNLENCTMANGHSNELSNALHNDENDNHNINSLINMQDNIPIIKDGARNGQQMSAVRKFCFVVSILVCFMTIVLFLWVLPCDEGLTCPAIIRNDVVHTNNWEKSYIGIELKNAISVVPGVMGRSKNLVILFRGDAMNPNRSVQGFQNIPQNGGGIISIVGSSGKIAWYIPQHRVPTDLDCSLLDVDDNGVKDCIVVGENGLLETIHPIAGTVIWHLHKHNESNTLFTSVNFPLILPDLDNDSVSEILTSCSINHGDHNHLIIVNGRTGAVIGKPLKISGCVTIHTLNIEKNYVSFICQNKTFNSIPRDSSKGFELDELYQKITNRASNLKNLNNDNLLKQRQQSQRNVYIVDNRKLIIQNEGTCPGKCRVSVQLFDQRNGTDNLTWSHPGHNMYGMVPAKLQFSNTPLNCEALKGHISGFILKFWQWNEPRQSKDTVMSHKIHHYPYDTLLDAFLGRLRRKRSDECPTNEKRCKRTVDNRSATVIVQSVTERVVLITFNSTDIHIVNASQNEIIQLCTITSDGNRICQPDLNFQENSVLISDLDQDGSQELISYLSTYVNLEDNDSKEENPKWQLQSIGKVVRLEAELPKLYETVSKY